jgi:iron complex outermembrane receptor protein
MAATAMTVSAAEQPMIETAGDKEKLKALKQMFESRYSEEDYYRTDRLIGAATGSPKPLYRAPAVGTVITAEDIEDMGATSLREVLETVPGLHVSLNTAGRADSIFAVRGILTPTNPQVLLLINGVPLTEPYHGGRPVAFRMPVSGIQRVEVIRGPGSALYGADAFAGTINVILKDANDIDGTEMGGRVGSFDTYDVWLQHGGTWHDWEVAVGAEYLKSGGDRTRILKTDTQSGLDQLFGTSASKAPGPLATQYEILNARLDLTRGNWNLGLWSWTSRDAGFGDGATHLADSGSYGDEDVVTADLLYRNADLIRNWELGFRVSYNYIHDNSYFILFPAGAKVPVGDDGNFFTPGGGLVTFTEGAIGNPSGTHQTTRTEITGLYSGLVGHTLRLGAGEIYVDMKTGERKNFGPGVLDGSEGTVDGTLTDVSGTPYVFTSDQWRNIWYGLVQDEWVMAKNWELTLGARYDHYSDFGSTFNPRAALVWETRYDLTTKLLYGRAFRPPAFAELYARNNPAVLGNEDLKPETIQTVELVFDYLPRRNLRTILNLFYYRIKDLIRFDEATPEGIRARNVGRQKGQGFEFETVWTPTPTFLVRGNIACQWSKDQDTDQTVPNAPRYQAYLNSHWEFAPDWSIDAQLFWIADRERAMGDNREAIDDYTWVNLTLRRKHLWKQWDAALAVRNVFDEDAREPSVPAISNDYPLESRSLWAELRYHF